MPTCRTPWQADGMSSTYNQDVQKVSCNGSSGWSTRSSPPCLCTAGLLSAHLVDCPKVAPAHTSRRIQTSKRILMMFPGTLLAPFACAEPGDWPSVPLDCLLLLTQAEQRVHCSIKAPNIVYDYSPITARLLLKEHGVHSTSCTLCCSSCWLLLCNPVCRHITMLQGLSTQPTGLQY
jgi:hypothetical protein